MYMMPSGGVCRPELPAVQVTLRRCAASKAELETSLAALKADGFVNYFGLQVPPRLLSPCRPDCSLLAAPAVCALLDSADLFLALLALLAAAPAPRASVCVPP